jgi:hypothetical protein
VILTTAGGLPDGVAAERIVTMHAGPRRSTPG